MSAFPKGIANLEGYQSKICKSDWFGYIHSKSQQFSCAASYYAQQIF